MSNFRINPAALTRLMKERGIDARALAEMTTLDNESVNRIIESGIVGYDDAVGIAVVLNVGLHELLMPLECGTKLKYIDEQLKPCKRCGDPRGRWIPYGHFQSNQITYRISCPMCSYCTKEKKSRADAVEAWNRRCDNGST